MKSDADRQGRFQPAKTAGRGSRFVQIVAKPRRAARRKSKEPKLTRVAFRVSRLMEFCTIRELQNQTGHDFWHWPLVVLKELTDNALDACEEAEVAPVISIAAAPGTIEIRDNGGGIKSSTVKSILDYMIRVSSREAYVSPTRGAQGNALKTILAMGYVIAHKFNETDAEAMGMTIIETGGVEHRIEFRVDHVNNEPKITHAIKPSPITLGTKVTVAWTPKFMWWDHYEREFKNLAESYIWVNPHLTLRASWHGKEFIGVEATNPAWEKWRPRNPTSAHWYDKARLQRYLAAHVARDRALGRHRTVREFLSEFRGLARTAIQRKVLEEVGCSHQSLAQFFGVDQVNRAGIAKLLASIRFDARRSHIPQVHHRRQLERRDQQPVPRFRKNWRGSGEHVGEGAGQRHPAGDLRPAPRVRLHSIRGPRQELDHPHRRRGAAR